MPTNDAAGYNPPQMPTPDPDILQSIRIGWRDLAGETARNIQRISQATVEQALEMGKQLWRMQRDLKRKEYSTFLSVLGWASAKARKLINLAKVFDGFESSQLTRVELMTLLSLCSKRYSAVVEQLREVEQITQQLVEQMIKQTKKPRLAKQDPISGWKANRAGGSRRYEVHLHDEQTGLSIEQQAQAEAILPHRVIQEAVALRLKSKPDQEGDSAIVVKQVLEQPDEQERSNAIREQIEAEAQQQARSRFEMLEFGLKQQIAHLEAQLAAVKSSEIVKPSTATGLQSSTPLEVIESPTTTTGLQPVQALEATFESTASIVTDDAVASEPIESATEVQPSDDEEVALESDQLNEYPDVQVAEFASIQPSEPEGSPAQTSDDYLEPISSDAEKQRKENVAQNLGAEHNSVFQSGDLVQINAASDRTWNGLRGYIQKLVTKTCKAVVLLQGDYRTKHFFLDELKLVHEVEEDLSDAIQARAPQKELVEAYATNTIPQSSSAEPVSDGSTTTVTDDAVAPEQVQSPTTTTIPQDAVAPEQVQSKSLPQPSDDSPTSKQILAADWDLIQELRAAESSLRKIYAKIQGLNSKWAQSGSNIVERELKHLRSAKVSQLVELIDSSGLSAYYEEQQGFVRVVLAPNYVSAFILQSKSWSDVVLVVGSDGKQLLSALKNWTKESRQLLVQLLSAYLESEPSALGQIDWIPEKLLTKTLSLLPFKIRTIGGPDNLVDEPKIEYISCNFVSLEQIGTDRERWIFRDSNNNNRAVFGRDEIEVEKF